MPKAKRERQERTDNYHLLQLKRPQKQDALKPRIAHCKGGFGNWMKACGIWRSGLLTTPLANDERTVRLSNSLC